MKTVGFIISHKENEKRRALLPEHIASIKNKACLFFEEGYGHVLGIEDEDYLAAGCQIASREDVLRKDIICDPKIGDGDYLCDLQKGQTVFGWVHATQNRELMDQFIQTQLTAIAWEEMYEEGRHVFWRNNEIAGEAAILHAIQFEGSLPSDAKVALIGNGNVGRGAFRVLSSLGADVTVYDRKTERLFRKEIGCYDFVVNAVLWDKRREDHLVYREDLLKMKKGALIIDISCDRKGAIETSVPTTIDEPVYEVEGIKHYVVDHTPSLFFKTVSRGLSEIVSYYMDQLIEDKLGKTLEEAIIVK